MHVLPEALAQRIVPGFLPCDFRDGGGGGVRLLLADLLCFFEELGLLAAALEARGCAVGGGDGRLGGRTGAVDGGDGCGSGGRGVDLEVSLAG